MNKISQSWESNTTNSAPKESKFSPGVHVERKKKRVLKRDFWCLSRRKDLKLLLLTFDLALQSFETSAFCMKGKEKEKMGLSFTWTNKTTIFFNCVTLAMWFTLYAIIGSSNLCISRRCQSLGTTEILWDSYIFRLINMQISSYQEFFKAPYFSNHTPKKSSNIFWSTSFRTYK